MAETVDVLLFTSDEPLYLPRYLQPLLAEHADSIERVVLAPPTRGTVEQLYRQFAMFGPVDFLRIGARFAGGRVLGTLPPAVDRLVTGRHHSVPSVAAAHDIPYERVDDVSTPSFVDRVRMWDPDVILSIVCGQKLPAALLEVPDAAINIHGSLLPEYRGRATAFWPLYYGDDESGVTAHLMTDDYDAGPIIDQRSFRLESDDTMHDVYLKIADAGAALAIDLLERPLDDMETRPNPTRPEDYHTLPTPEERREFKRRGNEFR